MNWHHVTGLYRTWILQAAQQEAVAHHHLKALESWFPLPRDRGRFYVDRTHVPAESLVQNVIQIKPIALPARGCAAGFKGNGALLPNILNRRAHYLLRVDFQHF